MGIRFYRFFHEARMMTSPRTLNVKCGEWNERTESPGEGREMLWVEKREGGRDRMTSCRFD